MRMLGLPLALGGIAVALSGCQQLHSTWAEILIGTNPPGAACTIVRGGQLLGYVASTPGIVNLDPEMTTGLGVTCRRPGYADVAMAVPPNVIVHTWAGTYPEPQQVEIPLIPLPALALRR